MGVKAAMQTLHVLCRNATTDDVDSLYQLILGYAEKGIMLPRSKEALLKNIDTFVIAEVDGDFVGCGALTKLGDDLVEIRSLGMTENFKGLGIGGKIVLRLIENAQAQGISKIMALTLADSFFIKNGFTVVDKGIFPEKVWTDCLICPKRHACDEIAVMKKIL